MKDKIFNSFFIILSFTLLGKVFGFVEKLLIAYYFGTRWEVDAFFVAVNLALVIYFVTDEILQPTFLPLFLKLRDDSHQKAFRFTNSVIALFGALLVIISIVCVQFSEFFIHQFAPGFMGETLYLAANLFKIMSLVIVFQGLSVLLYYFLNSHKIFFIPALGQFTFKMMSVLGIMVFYSYLGIKSLALAFLTAVVFKFLILVIGIAAKRLYHFTKIYFKNVGMREFLLLIAPIVVGTLFVQLSNRVDDYFASMLSEGMLSSINYAKRVIHLPLVVLPHSLCIVLLPFLSSYTSDPGNQENIKKLKELFNKWFQIVIFIFILIEIYFLLMDKNIIQLIFERGEFSRSSTLLTAQAFFYYSLGLVAFAADFLLMQLFYAFRDTKTPIIIGIACVVLNILLTILLIKQLQHRAIGLAFSVHKTIKVIILLCLIQSKVPIFERRGFLLGVRSMFITVGPALFILVFCRYLFHYLLIQQQLPFQNVLYLSFTFLTSFGSAFFIAYKMKLFYMDEMPQMVKGMISRGRK